MNVKSADVVLKHPVCTWLSESDYAQFATLARANGVSVAAYLRSIVVDVLVEERSGKPCVDEQRQRAGVR